MSPDISPGVVDGSASWLGGGARVSEEISGLRVLSVSMTDPRYLVSSDFRLSIGQVTNFATGDSGADHRHSNHGLRKERRRAQEGRSHQPGVEVGGRYALPASRAMLSGCPFSWNLLSSPVSGAAPPRIRTAATICRFTGFGASPRRFAEPAREWALAASGARPAVQHLALTPVSNLCRVDGRCHRSLPLAAHGCH